MMKLIHLVVATFLLSNTTLANEIGSLTFKEASMFLIRTGYETGFYFKFESSSKLSKENVHLAISKDLGESWDFINCKQLSVFAATNVCFGTLEGYILDPDQYRVALVIRKKSASEYSWYNNSGELFELTIL